MSLFLAIAVSSFLAITALQYMLIGSMLPRGLTTGARRLIALSVTLVINTVPFLYMATEGILDDLPWWHRELIVFPYAIFTVASAFSGLLLLMLLFVRSTLAKVSPQFDKGRRDFLGNAARTLAGSSVGVLAYGAYNENGTPEISRVVLPYSGLHRDLCGFRLVHITDIHAGPLISFETIAEAVARANALKPDLIVLTGDYINHNPAYVDGCLRLLDDLKAPAGVFGVYGNHDYYAGIDNIREAFSKTRISMLGDRRSAAKGLEGLLNIIGVDDPVLNWATDARFKNVDAIFGLANTHQFNLLLSHRPGIFSVCKDRNVQLTLAGHTHGGQVIVPGVGERGFSLASLFLTYTHGLYESDKDPEVRMYVNRGIGTIIAPVRLFCNPEIVEIILTRG